MITPTEISGRLKALRKSTGMTQEQFADKAGMPRAAYWKVESDTRNMKIEELATLSISLGFSIDDFLANDLEPVRAAILLSKVTEELGVVLTAATQTFHNVTQLTDSIISSEAMGRRMEKHAEKAIRVLTGTIPAVNA